MSISKYLVFKKVCDTGSITKAAKELSYTQSGISQIISNMEKSWGLPLIVRHKNGIELTDCGREILKPVSEIVRNEILLDQLVNSLKNADAGSIRLGVLGSVMNQWVPDIISSIITKHPLVEVDILQEDYSVLEEYVCSDRLDCSFLSYTVKGRTDFISMYKDELYVVMHADNPLTKFGRIPIELLEHEPFILVDEGDTKFPIQNLVSSYNLGNIKMTVKEDTGALNMVAKGIGCTIIPELSLIYHPADPNLVVKRFAIPRHRVLGLSFPKNGIITPLLQLFIDETQQYVNKFSADRENAHYWFSDMVK